MINPTYSLTYRTEELEEKVEELEKTQNNSNLSINCVNFSKSFANLPIITSKNLEIATATLGENASIYLQLQVDISAPTSEKVFFGFYVDDICIHKTTRTLSSGDNQIIIMKDYTSITSQDVKIYLEVRPVDEKIIFLQTTNLFVWGLVSERTLVKYQIIPSGENLFLAFIDNSQIYYKLLEFENVSLCYDDFEVLDSAKDFSAIYHNGDIVIFKVDLDGNLTSYSIGKLGNNFYL